MAVVIDGTTGISTPAEAVAGNLSYTGTLTGGTGVVNLGSGQVYKDASGNVGIGTSSPTSKLDARLAGTSSGSVIQVGNTSSGEFGGLGVSDGGAYPVQLWGSSLAFLTGSSIYGSTTERARIDSSGNLLVGTTDSTKGALTVGKVAPSSAYGQICALSPTAGDSNISGMSVVKYANDSTTAQVLIRFLMNQGSTGQGQINANGANTAAFGSYSDSRLKENIVNLPSQLDSIMALRPVEYDYIESMGGGHQIGFVAQEVQAIYPDLVGEDAEGMLTLTDMNKNDARLIKAIQEQQTLITALTARITALETAA